MKKNNIKKNRVLIGLSGGVDSSASCVLLKEQGYEVEAVFVKVWQPDFIECNWREEMRDAMRVCAQLEIPFHFLDLEEEYKKEVVDYFIEEYKKGNTPNPDIMCNKYMKFGHLFDFAMKKGFDFVATGHYAKTKDGELFRGEDENKDQSYFLWTLTKEKLEKILFPIGEIEKEKVRKIAEENNLFNSKKKDSQGVCILGPIDMKDFLKKYADVQRGNVLNEQGEVIGSHEGSILYTIGERHGFKIDPEHKKTDSDILYIVSKNTDKNTITVSPNKLEVKVSSIKIKDINHICHPELACPTELQQRRISGTPLEIEFQTRYRQKTQKGILKGDILEGEFSEIPAIGQSVVFYEGDKCLGGGIIEELN
jgi:tRNA-specific 2-thiouridylase